jgi:hypothetical protein
MKAKGCPCHQCVQSSRSTTSYLFCKIAMGIVLGSQSLPYLWKFRIAGIGSHGCAGGIFVPIIKSLSESAGSLPGATSKKLGSFLTFTLLHVSNFSSNLFLTAAAQNLLCLDLAAQAGAAVSSPWLTWFIAAAPPCIVGMLVTPLVMYKVRVTMRLSHNANRARVHHQTLQCWAALNCHAKGRGLVRHHCQWLGCTTVALLNIEPLGSEFGDRSTWKLQSDLGYFPPN